MSSDFGYIIGVFQNNTELVRKATEGIPPEQWGQRPGDSSNHMLWILGHLIWCRGIILKTLGAEGAPPWGSHFARGTKPESLDQYPSVEEIRNTWSDMTGRLTACLSGAPRDVLAQPHDKPTLDGTTGGFVAFLAFHETYHAGQLSYLRKWLGQGQVVG